MKGLFTYLIKSEWLMVFRISRISLYYIFYFWRIVVNLTNSS